MTTLTGTVERVIFRSPDSDFAVARMRIDGVGNQTTYEDSTTIVGSLARVSQGEELRVSGEWERHPKHGPHFRVFWLEQRLPATVEGIEKFLGSGLIKGVGSGTAARIVGWFGEQTLDVIDKSPQKLFEVPHLSRKRATLVIDGWKEQSQGRELMLFLQSHNLPLFLAKRLLDKYGEQCVSILQSDPYKLVEDVSGVGFKTADGVALELGLSRTSSERFVAGLKHVLEEAAREGHVFLPRDVLLERASLLLAAQPPQIEPALLDASRQSLLILDGMNVYLGALFHAERGAAVDLTRLRAGPSVVADRLGSSLGEVIATAIDSLGIQFTEKQVLAVKTALENKVSIITGGPGTGKTMCLHALITALDLAELAYILCAPTGRAAKRMTSATGKPASTIHRLLGYQPGSSGFLFQADNPLDAQVVIVDEVSMLDISLLHYLAQAIPENGHLVLVGDVDQLPAVGPGSVLSDLLESGTVGNVCLEELFRQAEGSRIIRFAHQVRRGQQDQDGQPDEGSDLFLIRVRDGEAAARVIEEMVTRRIPARFGLDPKLEVQVLSPGHRGAAGVSALNRLLQAALTLPSEGKAYMEVGGGRLHVGDKVMQMRNNYDKNVFNGDLGIVAGIDGDNGAAMVRIGEQGDWRDIEYDSSDLANLSLAYAASVHKAQGSEFPCVVIPLLMEHYPLLKRNLLYTAVTRARRLCVIVHQPKALAIAIATNNESRRYSGLKERLTKQDVCEIDAFEDLLLATYPAKLD